MGFVVQRLGLRVLGLGFKLQLSFLARVPLVGFRVYGFIGSRIWVLSGVQGYLKGIGVLEFRAFVIQWAASCGFYQWPTYQNLLFGRVPITLSPKP